MGGTGGPGGICGRGCPGDIIDRNDVIGRGDKHGCENIPLGRGPCLLSVCLSDHVVLVGLSQEASGPHI